MFQSALNHDIIMNAHDEEKMRLEEHASQVAQRAAEALRQSRMLRSRDDISIPTWTGRSGSAGAPLSVRQKFGSTVNSQLTNKSSKPSEGTASSETRQTSGFAAGASAGRALSSADLLARIRGNQERAVGNGLEDQVDGASSSLNGSRTIGGPGPGPSSRSSQKLYGVQPEILIRQLCTFMQQKGGTTDSAGIVNHFKDRIPSKDLPLFKNLLKEIANLQKDQNGSSWVLNPEYRE